MIGKRSFLLAALGLISVAGSAFAGPLQTLIDGAPAGTNLVVPGNTNYPEQIVISKPITLIGSNWPKICPSLSPANGYYCAAVRIAASGVTIRGFEIYNATNTTSGEQHAIWDGVWENGPSNIRIENCIIHDIQHGVRLYGGGIVVNGCEFYRLRRSGVYASGPNPTNFPQSLTVYNCVFRDWSSYYSQGTGVRLAYSNRVATICYNYFGGMRFGVAKIYGGPKFLGIDIHHNTFVESFDPNAPVKMQIGVDMFSGSGEPYNGNYLRIYDNIFNRATWYAICQEGGWNSTGELGVGNNLFFENNWAYWPSYRLTNDWPNETGVVAQVGWEGPTNWIGFYGNLLEQSPEFIKFGTNSWLQHVLNVNSPAWGAASDGGNIGAWQGVLVTMGEIGPICVGTASNVPVEVYREPMPAGTVVRMRLEEGENAKLLDANGNETNEVVWTNAGSHVLVVTGKQASATVSNLLLSATVETATGQEWKQQERRFWVVGLGSLAYRWGTNDWRSAAGTNYVPLGTNVEFQASPSPAESSWPVGKPVWTGVEGSGATVSRMFTASGLQEVIAECGNALTARAGVIFIDIAQTETNVSSSLTNAALTLTPESYWAEAGGGSVVWESSPTGLVVVAAGNGEFRFNPSASQPTSYVVRAYFDLLPVCSDACIVNITKPPVPNVDLDGQELVALPNTWRDVPDEEEVAHGVLLINGRTKLLIRDPGTNAGKFTLAWTNPAPNKQIKLIGQGGPNSPVEIDCVGPWPKEYQVVAAGNWSPTDSVEVILTHSLSENFDTVKLVELNVKISADINMDGAIDASDDLDKDTPGKPGLLVGVNNNTHATDEGLTEVDYADGVINGLDDKNNDLKALKLTLTHPLTNGSSGSLILRCSDNASVRIFNEKDVAVIGPGLGKEHTIPAATVPAGGIEYRIEAIEGGQEVTVELEYKPVDGGSVIRDSIKVSTVGMSSPGGYYLASLDRTIAKNVLDATGKTTDCYYVGVEKLEYDRHPACVIVSLENVVTKSVLDGLKNGAYTILDTNNIGAGYGVPLEKVIKSERVFLEFLDLLNHFVTPPWTADQLYKWILASFRFNPGQADYYWQLPRIYTPGKHPIEIRNSANGQVIKRITLWVLKLDVEYVGGTNATNATQEGVVTLDEEYFMKGYLLKITAPEIKAGTPVAWSITKGDLATGTYHQGMAWTNYATNLPAIPTTRTVYWRSDLGGSITDEYNISAAFALPDSGAQATCARKIKSRQLSHTNSLHANGFNEDADMAQRAMIQVFYLDKGRLNVYRPGQYDAFASNGFYRSDSHGLRNWSSIADEVGNFRRFAMNTGPRLAVPCPLSLDLVQGIWNQFGLILAAGVQPAQDTNTPDYITNWVPNAITTAELTMPEAFGKTSAEVLKALVRQEGGRHSYERSGPLAVSSIQIGEKDSSTGGVHTYTDGGLGYCKVQPYHAGGRNIYTPQGNLIRGAIILQGNIVAVANPGETANEKVWFALFRYNYGSFVPDLTPAELRSAGNPYTRSVNYADGIFGALGLTPP